MVMVAPVGDRGMKILRVIADYIDAYGYPPTMREIQTLADVSSMAVVMYWFDRLEAAELMKRDRNTARSTVLTVLGKQIVAIDRPP